MSATTTVLAVAENPDAAEELRNRLQKRQQETGLEEALARVRYGKAIEQIAAEQAETLYEMLVMTTSKAAVLPVRLRHQRYPPMFDRCNLPHQSQQRRHNDHQLLRPYRIQSWPSMDSGSESALTRGAR